MLPSSDGDGCSRLVMQGMVSVAAAIRHSVLRHMATRGECPSATLRLADHWQLVVADLHVPADAALEVPVAVVVVAIPATCALAGGVLAGALFLRPSLT